MKIRTTRVLTVLLLGVAVGGCELVVDFDRSKIDAGGVDGSFVDAPTSDVANDNNVNPDSGGNDGGSDGATDAGGDAADATTPDSGSDASVSDAGDGGGVNDAGADADDGSADAASE